LDEDKYGKFNFEINDNLILKTAYMNNYKHIIDIALQYTFEISPNSLSSIIKFICDKRDNKIKDLTKLLSRECIKNKLYDSEILKKLSEYADFKGCYKIKTFLKQI
jgi:hypothetical protein